MQIKKLLITLLLFLFPSFGICGTYYVSYSTGNDNNEGSITAPFKTLAKVQAVATGENEKVYLMRGDTWNEGLYLTGITPTVDAYGTEAKPILMGDGINHVLRMLYGGTYSNLDVRNSVTGKYNLRVAITGGVTVNDVVTSGGDGLLICGQSATFNRCYFNGGTGSSGYTIYIDGSAQETTFNYCWFDGLVKEFRVNAATTVNLNNCLFSGASEIALFSINGSQNININNCIFVGNGQINPAGSYNIVKYSGSGTVTAKNCILSPPRSGYTKNTYGITDGGGNIKKCPLFVRHRRPFIILLTVHDQENVDYATSVAAKLNAVGWKLNYVIPTRQASTGQTLSSDTWTKINALYAAGNEICLHNKSDGSLTESRAITIQRTGGGTSCTMTISNGMLTTTLNGSPDLNINLDNYNLNTLDTYVTARGYTLEVVGANVGTMSAYDLENKDNVDILSAPVEVDFATNHINNQISDGKAELEAHVSGLTVRSYSPSYDVSNDDVVTALANNGFLIGFYGWNGKVDMSDLEIFKIADFNISTYIGTDHLEENLSGFIETLGWMGGIIQLYCHNATEVPLANWDRIISVLKNSDVKVMTMTEAANYIRENGIDADGNGKRWTRTFTNNPDYTLRMGSPAIDAGNTNPGLTTDYLQKTLWRAPDIGLYEYYPKGLIP